MQATRSLQGFKHMRSIVLVIVAVAALSIGVAFGRWIVPDEGSSANAPAVVAPAQDELADAPFTIETYPSYTP